VTIAPRLGLVIVGIPAAMLGTLAASEQQSNEALGEKERNRMEEKDKQAVGSEEEDM